MGFKGEGQENFIDFANQILHYDRGTLKIMVISHFHTGDSYVAS